MSKNLDYEELKNLFEIANKRFLLNNKTLIYRELSERCLCANLAYELRDEFRENYNDIYVDVEFNRVGFNKKENQNGNGKIICDLIVHDRYDLNYIALEMKKTPKDAESVNKDKDRLVYLTEDVRFHYMMGIFYELLIDKEIIRISYKNGKSQGFKTEEFTLASIFNNE